MHTEKEMFSALSKAVEDKRDVDFLIDKCVRVAVVRLGMGVADIRRLTGFGAAESRKLVEEYGKVVDHRPPPRDPVTARQTVEKELVELLSLRGKAERIAEDLAKRCVLTYGMSANEMARRTGWSRHVTQRLVKESHKPSTSQEQGHSAPGGLRTFWDDGVSEVDPIYVISEKEAKRRRESGYYDTMTRSSPKREEATSWVESGR